MWLEAGYFCAPAVRPVASAKPGEQVVNEVEAADSAQPQGFLRRHRAAVIIVAAIVVLIFALVKFVHYKQAVAAKATFARGRGGGGPNSAVAVSVATVTSGDR